MQRRFLGLMVGVAIALVTVSPAQSAEAVHFRTADGVKVFADYYASPNPAAPFILCFHMANANRGEYASIAPSLVNQGFQVLAIDQRSGGFAYEQRNDTAKQFALPQDYLSAMPDIEAAIAWARDQPSIDWIDLGVFSDNPGAQALYVRHGFPVVGRTPDRVRVDGQSLDETSMTLNVARIDD